MLNEILEFEAYVKVPESADPRIQPKMLTENYESDDLNGIGGILVILARGFIFGFETEKKIYNEDGLVNENILNDTKYILLQWCGFDLNASESKEKAINDDLENHRQCILEWQETYPEANGWLKKYWLYHCPENKKEQWKKVESKLNDKLCGENEEYSQNRITLASVIAIALAHGPLRKRYMILRKDTSKKPEKDSTKRFAYLYSRVKPHKDGSGKTVHEQTREKILKNIAAYLISKEYHPKNQKFIRLDRGRLMGWYGLDDYRYAREAWYRPRFIWEEKQIMEAHSGDRGWSFIKLSINQEFLEYFEFQLISEEQIDDIDKSRYWILEDTGHGTKSLECLE